MDEGEGLENTGIEGIETERERASRELDWSLNCSSMYGQHRDELPLSLGKTAEVPGLRYEQPSPQHQGAMLHCQ